MPRRGEGRTLFQMKVGDDEQRQIRHVKAAQRIAQGRNAIDGGFGSEAFKAGGQSFTQGKAAQHGVSNSLRAILLLSLLFPRIFRRGLRKKLRHRLGNQLVGGFGQHIVLRLSHHRFAADFQHDGNGKRGDMVQRTVMRVALDSP